MKLNGKILLLLILPMTQNLNASEYSLAITASGVITSNLTDEPPSSLSNQNTFYDVYTSGCGQSAEPMAASIPPFASASISDISKTQEIENSTCTNTIQVYVETY